MAVPVLDTLDIAGKTLTADALLTQRTLADYRRARDAHYVLIAKDNLPTLLADLRLSFRDARSARLRRVAHLGPRAHLAARHLDHRRTQRLPRLPRRRHGLRHRTPHRGQ